MDCRYRLHHEELDQVLCRAAIFAALTHNVHSYPHVLILHSFCMSVRYECAPCEVLPEYKCIRLWTQKSGIEGSLS